MYCSHEVLSYKDPIIFVAGLWISTTITVLSVTWQSKALKRQQENQWCIEPDLFPVQCDLFSLIWEGFEDSNTKEHGLLLSLRVQLFCNRNYLEYCPLGFGEIGMEALLDIYQLRSLYVLFKEMCVSCVSSL